MRSSVGQGHAIERSFSSNRFHLFVISRSENTVIAMKVLIFVGIIFMLSQTMEGKPGLQKDYLIIEKDPDYPLERLNALNLWKENFDRLRPEHKVKRSFLAEAKLCESSISYRRPQKLKNTRNVLRTVVNHQNYTQYIRFETCQAENFPCTFNIYPNTARSFCNQTYSIVHLKAYDERRNCLVEEDFSVPTACDCMIDKSDFLRDVKKDLLHNPRVHY